MDQETVVQVCPICGTKVRPYERYPRYLCSACAGRAVCEKGRPLSFSNTDLSGGFEACYADTGEPREGHACYVDGVACRADEARFGGIVIQTAGSEGA